MDIKKLRVKSLKLMIGTRNSWKILEYAISLYNCRQLDEEDLEEISSAIDSHVGELDKKKEDAFTSMMNAISTNALK